MNCGLPVAVRSYNTVMVKSIPPKTVNVISMKRLSSWRRKKYILEDGSYMEAIICSECENINIDIGKIDKAVEAGWKATLRQENKTNKEIEQFTKALSKIERNENKIKEYKKESILKENR